MNSTGPTTEFVCPSGRQFFFQLGPVKEFIDQARSTRDLWSGSYLLSWMTGHVIHQLRTVAPESVLVFPQFIDAGGSMMDWIAGRRHRDHAKAATLPTIPNRFLAVVPETFDAAAAGRIVARVFDYDDEASEWRRITEACRCWFEDPVREPHLFESRGRHEAGDLRALWDRQLRVLWQPTWTLWPDPGFPLAESAAARELFRLTPVGRRWTEVHPDQPPGEWMVRYHTALHRFDARRQTRAFDAWQGMAGWQKDSLSGREEGVGTPAWLAGIPRHRGGRSCELNHHFRKDDCLGAPNLVKRVWHKAYLEMPAPAGAGLNKRTLDSVGTNRGSYFDIPSVPGLAVFPWARAIWAAPGQPGFEEFLRAVDEIGEYLDLELPKWTELDANHPNRWLARVDWEVFRERYWIDRLREAQREAPVGSDFEERRWLAEKARAARKGAAALRRLRDSNPHLPSPSSYYAVLAGDGDTMGRWLSGEASDGTLFPVTYEFHRALSAGIADFSGRNSRLSRVIEDIDKRGGGQPYTFQGKIIYAGGEDVLAVLPADQAIDCALTLRHEYRGAMDIPGRPPNSEFTYSVGIAIGHVKEPLQDMVEAAQDAERRAKGDPVRDHWNEDRKCLEPRIADGLGRNALAVTLFKRSGETIRWGARFDSAAFPLLDAFRESYRRKLDRPNWVPPIAGRFPHRLAGLLASYGGSEELTPDLARIVAADFVFVLEQQAPDLPRSAKASLVTLACDYLVDLTGLQQPKTKPAPDPVIEPPPATSTLHEWAGSYLGDQLRKFGPDAEAPPPRGRQLREFYHLFLMEAFIARQGD